MSFRLIIKPLAEQDLTGCCQWYNEQKQGLGDEFLNEVEVSLRLIANNPLHYQVRYKEIRMIKVRRFPVCVHYKVEKTEIFVLAILSTHRDPQIWRKR